ncbi:SRF-TF domain containing protein [Asbolus verrucosus]|uniref:Serum response factor homolog n=1 Tax=Asbolus verrucosus TaxID=1661398 RepID=A0A482VSE9_ASBVE|nr:SRF-TF domain containing protein [Asbolus verrucosus]
MLILKPSLLQAYELSTLTGTQVMLLVASETGHVYTFATRKLQPMITSEAGKALIQTCLNSPDPPAGSASGDQRMSATGFEETELTYNISDEDSKVRQMVYGSPHTHTHAHSLGGQGHYSHLEQGHLGLGGSPQHGGYSQACPSPLPPPHQGYGHPQHPHSHSHMTHSHPQR